VSHFVACRRGFLATCAGPVALTFNYYVNSDFFFYSGFSVPVDSLTPKSEINLAQHPTFIPDASANFAKIDRNPIEKGR